MRFSLLLSLALTYVAADVPSGTFTLQTDTTPPLQARHCNYELFAVSGYPDYIEEDFNFTIVPGVLAMSSPCLFLCYCLL